MASAKKTIYLPSGVDQYLEDAETLSGRIAAIVLRYQHLTREAIPRLSRQQWCAVCDANNGADDLLYADHPGLLSQMLTANVADTPGLGEKWDIDQQRLINTMLGWTFAEHLAAYEVVRYFWRHCDRETDELLREAGAI